jgi:hypothetical protein
MKFIEDIVKKNLLTDEQFYAATLLCIEPTGLETRNLKEIDRECTDVDIHYALNNYYKYYITKEKHLITFARWKLGAVDII